MILKVRNWIVIEDSTWIWHLFSIGFWSFKLKFNWKSVTKALFFNLQGTFQELGQVVLAPKRSSPWCVTHGLYAIPWQQPRTGWIPLCIFVCVAQKLQSLRDLLCASFSEEVSMPPRHIPQFLTRAKLTHVGLPTVSQRFAKTCVEYDLWSFSSSVAFFSVPRKEVNVTPHHERD